MNVKKVIVGSSTAVLLIGGVASCGGGDGEKASPSTDDTSAVAKPKAKSEQKKAASKPKNVLNADAGVANRVKEGNAYKFGDFKILKGWKVKDVGYGMGHQVQNLRVQNVTDSSHMFSAEVKLHRGKNVITAEIGCFTNDAAPKNIVTADCIADGEGKKFDYITIENSY